MQSAIKEKTRLVGMDRDQVLLAMGHPDHKYRESKDGVESEDWIFGTPPGKIVFVTFNGNKVVKVKEQFAGLGSQTVSSQQVNQRPQLLGSTTQANDVCNQAQLWWKQKQCDPDYAHQSDIGIEVFCESGAHPRDLLLSNDPAKFLWGRCGETGAFRARRRLADRLTAGSAETRGIGDLRATLRKGLSISITRRMARREWGKDDRIIPPSALIPGPTGDEERWPAPRHAF